MTNQSVLDMVANQVPAVTVINQIRASKNRFDLSTSGVIQLTKGGVPPAIIEAMRNPGAAPAAAPAASEAIHTVTLAGGMPFGIRLAEDVPIKLAAGQKISFKVARDVKVGDTVVIAKGSPLSGEVVEAGDGKKLLIVKNKATFRLATVASTAGTELAIRATQARSDKADRPIEMPGTKTKELLAPADTEYTAYIDGDQTVTLKQR